MSLSSIINILDPDAFIFGGGVSNEIDFLHEIIESFPLCLERKQFFKENSIEFVLCG